MDSSWELNNSWSTMGILWRYDVIEYIIDNIVKNNIEKLDIVGYPQLSIIDYRLLVCIIFNNQ